MLTGMNDFEEMDEGRPRASPKARRAAWISCLVVFGTLGAVWKKTVYEPAEQQRQDEAYSQVIETLRAHENTRLAVAAKHERGEKVCDTQLDTKSYAFWRDSVSEIDDENSFVEVFPEPRFKELKDRLEEIYVTLPTPREGSRNIQSAYSRAILEVKSWADAKEIPLTPRARETVAKAEQQVLIYK